MTEINCVASYVNKDQDVDYLIQLEDFSDGAYYILVYQKQKMAQLINDTREEKVRSHLVQFQFYEVTHDYQISG